MKCSFQPCAARGLPITVEDSRSGAKHGFCGYPHLVLWLIDSLQGQAQTGIEQALLAFRNAGGTQSAGLVSPRQGAVTREEEIGALLIQAYENKEIAAKLGMSVRTVKAHMNRMFLRYGIRDGIKRVKLAVLLYRKEIEKMKVTKTLISLLVMCLLSSHVSAQGPHYKKFFVHLGEHLALGAGTEVGISQLAGGPQKYTAGIVATGAVAGWKEGTDALDKDRKTGDTKKQAAWHAFSILAGAGIVAAIRH